MIEILDTIDYSLSRSLAGLRSLFWRNRTNRNGRRLLVIAAQLADPTTVLDTIQMLRMATRKQATE